MGGGAALSSKCSDFANKQTGLAGKHEEDATTASKGRSGRKGLSVSDLGSLLGQSGDGTFASVGEGKANRAQEIPGGGSSGIGAGKASSVSKGDRLGNGKPRRTRNSFGQNVELGKGGVRRYSYGGKGSSSGLRNRRRKGTQFFREKFSQHRIYFIHTNRFNEKFCNH